MIAEVECVTKSKRSKKAKKKHCEKNEMGKKKLHRKPI